jgi:hypothetical protein
MAGKYVLRYTGGRKGVVLITTVDGPPPVVTLPNGQTITGTQPPGIQKVEQTPAGPQYQWVLPGLDKYMGQPFTISHAGETSGQITITPQQELRTESGGLKGLDPAPNKAMYGSAGGGIGPGAVGGMPNYLGGMYPQFQPISFQPVQYVPIQPANYNLVDPEKFAEKYSKFNTDQFGENFVQGGKFALKQLETELQGLKSFVPAASALKRQELSVDNLFNQAQRDTQISRVLPDVQAGLKQATADAGVYSRGRFISDIEDRALETGLRSEAADIARSRGFGDNSVVGRKVSDLLSAKERFQIAQYGNQLKESNAVARQQLELAPTSYSDAGQQIRVTPEEGAGRAQARYTGELNAANLIPTGQAFQSQIGQEQFRTNLEQRTNEFNASNRLQNDQFNTSTSVDVAKYNSSNSFAAQLGKFNYDVGYSNALAGFQQAEINRTREDAIRDQLTQEFEKAKTDAQRIQAAQTIIAALGKIPGAIDAIRQILGAFGVGGGSTSSGTSITTNGRFDTVSGTSSDAGTVSGTASPGSFVPTTVTVNTDGTASIPGGSTVPEGFTPVSSNVDGSVGVVPTSQYNNPYYRAFLRAGGAA